MIVKYVATEDVYKFAKIVYSKPSSWIQNCWLLWISTQIFFHASSWDLIRGKKTSKWTFKIEIWPVWSQWGVLLQKLKSTKRGVKSSRNTQWVLKKYLLVDKKVCFGTTAALLLWGIFFHQTNKNLNHSWDL